MLDSMQKNPRPTRAEVGDVANAIFDGTDAVMLSGETAAGKYPLESVKIMADIAKKTETSKEFLDMQKNKSVIKELTVTNAISHATCTTAQDLNATAILTATSSGYTAKAVSKYRPTSPIIAATTREDVMRKLAVVWGVHPVLVEEAKSTDEIIQVSVNKALEENLINDGDLIVITAGVPVGVAGSTNLIKVHTVGEAIIKGTGIGRTGASGKVCIVNNKEDAKEKFNDGDIIVAINTDRDLVEYMKRTKIVCTLGPASQDEKVLRQLMLNGLNVARQNFSHGDHEEHKKRMDSIKKLREELNLPIAIMLDTKGPEIRTRDFENGEVELVRNQEFIFLICSPFLY